MAHNHFQLFYLLALLPFGLWMRLSKKAIPIILAIIASAAIAIWLSLSWRTELWLATGLAACATVTGALLLEIGEELWSGAKRTTRWTMSKIIVPGGGILVALLLIQIPQFQVIAVLLLTGIFVRMGWGFLWKGVGGGGAKRKNRGRRR